MQNTTNMDMDKDLLSAKTQRKLLGKRYYDHKLDTRDGLLLFIKRYQESGTLSGLAKIYGISRDTLYKWINNDQRMREAIENSKNSKIDQLVVDKLVSTLLQTALGYEHNGKYYPPNPKIIFELLYLFKGSFANPGVYFPTSMLAEYISNSKDANKLVQEAIAKMGDIELRKHITLLGDTTKEGER